MLELQYLFVGDFFLETDQILAGDEIFPDPWLAGPLPVQVLPSGPTYPTQTTQRLVVALIHRAQRRVVITTPYFIPDDPLLQSLETAVRRGVEVLLIVSATRDQLLVGLAQESYYEQLLEQGVRIHRYDLRFLHAKHLSIDDELALVGSSNMDVRSFALNAESSLLVYDRGFAARLRREQDRYLEHSRQLELSDWQGRKRLARFSQNLARMFSPLL